MGISILWPTRWKALIPLLQINSIKLINFISFGQLDLLVKRVLRSSLLIVIWLIIFLWFFIVLSSGKLFFFYQRVLLFIPNDVFNLNSFCLLLITLNIINLLHTLSFHLYLIVTFFLTFIFIFLDGFKCASWTRCGFVCLFACKSNGIFLIF